MNKPAENQSLDTVTWRVVYSDGGVFHTNAQSASEYILDRVFLPFMVMCVLMFSALLLALDIPFIPQIILFGAGVVSTFFWLAVFITINIVINRSLNITTIYTPLLLLPMQVMNAFFMNYVLKLFGTSYADGFNGLLEISVRTLIIFVCLDIFHGRYVAVQHSTYVDPDAPTPQRGGGALFPERRIPYPDTRVPSQPAPVRPALEATRPDTAFVANSPAEAVDQAPPPDRKSAPTRPSSVLAISKEIFDLKKILFIKSEDHYLVIQSENQSTMVRGKLSDVTAEIDIAWGVQINRSVWVALAAVDQVNGTSSGRMEVVMNDGSIFRVTESRRVFFMHCYEQMTQSGQGS